MVGYISYTDYKQQEIWDWQIYLLFVLVAIRVLFQSKITDAFLGGLVALLINGILFSIVFIIYKKEVYGFGDVLIHTCIGCYLGIENYLQYYVTTSVTLGIVAVGMLLYYRQNKEIPLVPWLFGCLIIYIGLFQ